MIDPKLAAKHRKQHGLHSTTEIPKHASNTVSTSSLGAGGSHGAAIHENHHSQPEIHDDFSLNGTNFHWDDFEESDDDDDERSRFQQPPIRNTQPSQVNEHRSNPTRPSDTLYKEVDVANGPLANFMVTNSPGDACSLVPPAYARREPSCIRIAYLQAVYNNVVGNMPVRQTNDNLSMTLAALDAANAFPIDPEVPAPATTLATAKRRLGIDPDAWIMNYALCSICWKHFTPHQVSLLRTPNCTTQNCSGIIYKVTTNARGQQKREPCKIIPQVSLIQNLRRILRRKGFRKLFYDSRSSPAGLNNDDDYVMTDIYDGDAWYELKANCRREVGNLGTVRDVPDNNACDERLTTHRFGLHLSVNLDWFGTLNNRPHSSGPIYIAINDLPREQRFLPINVICYTITPGPTEPTTEQLNHCMEPLIHDVVKLQKGIKMEIYDEDDNNVHEEEVYASVICNLCDTPAARKIAGTAGHSADVNPCPWCRCRLVDTNLAEGYLSNINDFDLRDDYDMLKQKYYYRDAPPQRQKTILANFGVRWSAFDCLPGWLPARSTALDFMHAVFLGVVATLFNKFLFGAHMFSGIGGTDSAKQRLENIVNSVQWPSHITRLPKNLGQNQSLKKADEWRRLLTVSPIILWHVWKDQHDTIPDTEPPSAPNEKLTSHHSRKRKSMYDTVLLLCCAVRLLSNRRITMGQAKAGHEYLVQYCRRLLMLKCPLTINHHLCMHLASMVKRFGPVYGWWLFPFERYNGMLKRVNTNGHDNGEMERTMLRNWVQGHLFYDLFLHLPDDASPHEQAILDKIVNTEASRARGSIMTELAIFRSEVSSNRLSLPKRITKSAINLHHVKLKGPGDSHTDAYGLLFEFFNSLWPDVRLRREMSWGEGILFRSTDVAHPISHFRKDGLRYGCASNSQTQNDSFAFIQDGGQRIPVRIDQIFVIHIPDVQKPPHVCAIVRRLVLDHAVHANMPWFLYSTLLGIAIARANEFHQHEIISASDIDCPLAKIPISLSATGQELWGIVSFDHVRKYILYITTMDNSLKCRARQSRMTFWRMTTGLTNLRV
ncbi:hypothetical protein JOM56_010009 [Amanita muscaria]